MSTIRSAILDVRAALALHEQDVQGISRLCRAALKRLPAEVRTPGLEKWVVSGRAITMLMSPAPPLPTVEFVTAIHRSELDATPRSRALLLYVFALSQELRDTLAERSDRYDLLSVTLYQYSSFPHRARTNRDAQRETELADEVLELTAFLRGTQSVSDADALRIRRLVEEHAALARTYSKAGNIPEAFFAIRMAERLLSRLQPRETESAFRALTTEVLLQYAGIQMQRGVHADFGSQRGATSLAGEVIGRVRHAAASANRGRAFQLKALCERQRDELVPAILSYRLAMDEFKRFRRLLRARMNVLHDQAVSMFLLGWHRRRFDWFEQIADMFDFSNRWFVDHDPAFAHIGMIRKQELLVKFGRAATANVLDRYEEPDAFASLSLPFRALFLRINAERHLVLRHDEDGVSHFLRAVALARAEQYDHQLRELEKLFVRFPDVLGGVLGI
jgi:hypothetical protein